MVILLSVNPSASMQANVAMIDAGIAEVAMSVVRQSLMKPRIVSETRPAASRRWNWTSSMLRLMKIDWSRTVCTRMSPGSALTISASRSLICRTTSTVFDPEIPVNIYELGLIYAIETDDAGGVKVEMTLTAPGCPAAQELPIQVRDAVLTVQGVKTCEVETVWDPPWDPSRMTEDARLALNMF